MIHTSVPDACNICNYSEKRPESKPKSALIADSLLLHKQAFQSDRIHSILQLMDPKTTGFLACEGNQNQLLTVA